MTIREIRPEDVSSVCQIYNHYIENTVVTFEETAVAENDMSRRIDDIRRCYPFFIAESGNEILGYAYGSRWMERAAYRWSAETTVYLKKSAVHRGVGTGLYSRLITDLVHRDLHTAIGIIALPNDASVALHEKFGFKKTGHFHEVGRKFNRWIDVGYWELQLKSVKTH